MGTNAKLPSAYVSSVLQNGVGRHICQLQRLTFKFCKSYASSRGMRDFIENHLLEFTRENPGTVVYLQPKRHHRPRLVAEYLNGEVVNMDVHAYTQEEICQWVEHLRTRSGQPIVRLLKNWHTDNPSIQGIWTPYTNRNTRLNLVQLPDEDLSKFGPVKVSASERLLEMAKQLRVKDQSEHLAERPEPLDQVQQSS